jgi:hypothetical protein
MLKWGTPSRDKLDRPPSANGPACGGHSSDQLTGAAKVVQHVGFRHGALLLNGLQNRSEGLSFCPGDG